MDAPSVVVAEIIRPRGLHGELIVRSQTDVPQRLETLRQAFVKFADGSVQPVEIERAWCHQGSWVLQFSGVDSIDAAERFRGADLWVPPDQRGQLPEGEFFQSDLIGCQLVDSASGLIVGTVQGWQQHGGPPLLELTVAGKEVLVPFVPAICSEIDLAARTIKVDLPEGLLDLNK
jgi:16S rRNA processing protein RimM